MLVLAQRAIYLRKTLPSTAQDDSKPRRTTNTFTVHNSLLPEKQTTPQGRHNLKHRRSQPNHQHVLCRVLPSVPPFHVYTLPLSYLNRETFLTEARKDRQDARRCAGRPGYRPPHHRQSSAEGTGELRQEGPGGFGSGSQG